MFADLFRPLSLLLLLNACNVEAAPYQSLIDLSSYQDPRALKELLESQLQQDTFNLVDFARLVARDAPAAPSFPPDSADLAALPVHVEERITSKIEARQAGDPAWIQAALERGQSVYHDSYAQILNVLSRPAKIINIRAQPALCTQNTRSMIDSCKKGVRSQVALCKQSERDGIATCKNNVKDEVDRCKKRNRLNLGTCELQRGPKMLECEGRRVNIPFCEFDRLTAGCCEGFRSEADALCNIGYSAEEIQKRLTSLQSKCLIATGIAKAAAKSYLSGQVLGIVSQVSAIKEIGDGVALIRRLDSTRTEYQKWAEGLIAAAEGRIQEAQNALVSLAGQIGPEVQKGIAWAEAAQAIVTKNVDQLTAKALAIGGEIEIIQSVTKAVEAFKPVAQNLQAIKQAAEKCRILPSRVRPDQFVGFKSVRSKADVDRAVDEYQRSIAALLLDAAQCHAVLKRITRISDS